MRQFVSEHAVPGILKDCSALFQDPAVQEESLETSGITHTASQPARLLLQDSQSHNAMIILFRDAQMCVCTVPSTRLQDFTVHHYNIHGS